MSVIKPNACTNCFLRFFRRKGFFAYTNPHCSNTKPVENQLFCIELYLMFLGSSHVSFVKPT